MIDSQFGLDRMIITRHGSAYDSQLGTILRGTDQEQDRDVESPTNTTTPPFIYLPVDIIS